MNCQKLVEEMVDLEVVANKPSPFVHYFNCFKNGDCYRIGIRGAKGECEDYLNQYYNLVEYKSSRQATSHDKKRRHTDAGLIVSCDIKDRWIE